MRGFRKINGINWLDYSKIAEIHNMDGTIEMRSLNKLPLHWNSVRNILLVNNK